VGVKCILASVLPGERNEVGSCPEFIGLGRALDGGKPISGPFAFRRYIGLWIFVSFGWC
jgi:hypothetical protein